MTGRRWLLGVVLVGLVWVVAGCHKNSGGDPPASSALPQGSPQANGLRALFDIHCVKCHMIAGAGRKGSGPDLTHVGSEHDAEWIADHIRDPKKHQPNSRMTRFDATLRDEQIKSLADWLATMK